ncbi:MAG: hypothetical protein IPJ06_02580 [Saprospiraceae bacterium]|nr:hypothetical protein [Saprospiraceae bacterium]
MLLPVIAKEEIITRTWTLTDDCGNDSIQTQIITAIDLITPTFPKPDDVTIYTEDGATCPGVADINLVADQMNPIVSGNAPFNFTVHGLLQAGPTVYSDNCSTAPNLDLYIWSVAPNFGGTADECMRSIRVIYRGLLTIAIISSSGSRSSPFWIIQIRPLPYQRISRFIQMPTAITTQTHLIRVT